MALRKFKKRWKRMWAERLGHSLTLEETRVLRPWDVGYRDYDDYLQLLRRKPEFMPYAPPIAIDELCRKYGAFAPERDPNEPFFGTDRNVPTRLAGYFS